MINRILVCLCLLVGLANAQWRSGGGSTFYWSLTGQAQKTDSLRIIQGTNMTITQSGNTVTFNGAAGAGSTANVRANTGWTSNGTTAQDTLATYYLINGKFQRQMWVDTDNDSVIIAPHSRFPFTYKDGATILSQIDSTGQIIAGDVSGTSIALNPTSANQPQIYFLEATDNANDWFRIYFVGTNNQLIIDGNENDAGNAYTTFNEFVDIGGNGGDPQSNLVLSSSGSGTVEMRATNSTTGASPTDGSVFGIGPSEQLNVWNYENTPTFFGTNNVTRMVISASGGVGIGATTDAQANRAKFNVLTRANGDTTVIFSADGGGVVGDSSALMNSAGKWGFGSATIASDEKIHITHTANVPLAVETATTDAGIRIKNSGSGGHSWFIDSASGASVVGTGNLGFYDETAAAIRLLLDASGYIGLGAGPAQLQGYVTIRTSAPTSDSLFVVRNNKTSAVDSTTITFADGDLQASAFNAPNRAITLAAAAATFAATSNVMTIDGDAGGNSITTITGGRDGMLLTLIFVDASVTLVNDDTHAANTLDLPLAANIVSADDTVVQLVYDGTSWYLVSVSVN